MKLIPLAYAIMFSLFAVPVALADPKKPAATKKPVVVAQPAKPAVPKPICGVIAGHHVTIPMEYSWAGAIYDADISGEGCEQPMIIMGIYLNIQDLSASPNMALSGTQSTYLIIGGLDRSYELGAKKAIDGDIIQRELTKQTNQEVFASTVSRKSSKLNDRYYYGHEYTYFKDASGKMIPYKLCKTYSREDTSAEVCEFLFQDEKLGLGFRVGFDPAVNLDYYQVRAQAVQAIALLTTKP